MYNFSETECTLNASIAVTQRKARWYDNERNQSELYVTTYVNEHMDTRGAMRLDNRM